MNSSATCCGFAWRTRESDVGENENAILGAANVSTRRPVLLLLSWLSQIAQRAIQKGSNRGYNNQRQFVQDGPLWRH